jgi:hypothetical protein
MAVAYDLVELLIGHSEEAFCLPVSVIPQALLAQERILEGDRQRRTIAPHEVAVAWRPIFGAGKGDQRTIGVTFKKFQPALETLRPIHYGFDADVGYVPQLVA